MAADVFKQVLADPAADNGIVRCNENRDDGVDPSAEFVEGPVSEGAEGADGALSCASSDGRLSDDHGIAEGQGQKDIDQKEYTSAVPCGEIRKAPDIAETDGCAGCGKDKSQLSGKTASCIIIHRNSPLKT